MKQAFPVIHVSVSQRCLADEPGLGLTVLLCTVHLGLSGGTSVSPRVPLPPEFGGWPEHALLPVTAEHPLHSPLSCHIEAGYRPNPESGGGEIYPGGEGVGVKSVEHPWEFD